MDPAEPEEPDGSGTRLVIWLLVSFALALVALVIAALLLTAGAGRDEGAVAAVVAAAGFAHPF